MPFQLDKYTHTAHNTQMRVFIVMRLCRTAHILGIPLTIHTETENRTVYVMTCAMEFSSISITMLNCERGNCCTFISLSLSFNFSVRLYKIRALDSCTVLAFPLRFQFQWHYFEWNFMFKTQFNGIGAGLNGRCIQCTELLNDDLTFKFYNFFIFALW